MEIKDLISWGTGKSPHRNTRVLGAGGAPGVTGVSVAEEVTKPGFVACPRRNFRHS